MEEKGRFIVFEGIDGSGKTTQIRLLAEHLKRAGRKVHITAEPTTSVSGGLLRDALCGARKRSPGELAALFLLDRINHNVCPVNGIEKLTSEGYDVICDRYYYSSLAYQGSQTDYRWVADMNLNCPEIRKPDICIFLDIDAKTAAKRISSDRAITEVFEKEQTLETVRNRYLEVFASLPEDNVKIINASGDVGEVAKLIAECVG